VRRADAVLGDAAQDVGIGCIFFVVDAARERRMARKRPRARHRMENPR
jgi:hypothetical protein